MNDEAIVALFWERSETAIEQTSEAYGGYCRTIAMRILGNESDVEECVSDAYLSAWNAIPPEHPNNLKTFLGKLTRNHALSMLRKRDAQKRGSGEMHIILDECQNLLRERTDQELSDKIAFRDALNQFLRDLPPLTRRVFLQRYWYMLSISEIARELKISESRVKMLLHRTRNKLGEYLKEGDLWM